MQYQSRRIPLGVRYRAAIMIGGPIWDCGRLLFPPHLAPLSDRHLPLRSLTEGVAQVLGGPGATSVDIISVDASQ
ncbi:hypothetical protein E2C01_083912 [Portunus trituberculatus]|uniref:Uncharacterized protein n=1 Tax=Portunus trituberculatus TaxID=210409 RepID=A0A5B7J9A4_PORTR|nr:hypothetical protein [Portunus trituberculatus]